MTTRHGVWVVASAGLAACAVQAHEDQVEDQVIERPIVPAMPKCQGYQCPYSQFEARVSTHFAGEASIDGMFNVDGVAITGALHDGGEPVPMKLAGARKTTAKAGNGIPVMLQISGDQLSAIETAPPFAVLSGPDLVGLTIWMTSTQDELFELTIDRVAFQDFHFWEGSPEPVPTYELTWLRVDPPDPGGVPAYVCSGDGLAGDPRWAAAPHAAMFYEGDRFDLEHITVELPLSPKQFNFACPGSPRAQMHLSRHTEASNHDGLFPSNHDQRQAMLKMLSADYCGDGTSNAITNYPLRWLDNTGWEQPPLDLDPKHGQIASIEAIWGPNGAVCLDTPRMIPRSQVGCSLPICQDVASWAQQGHLISANPPPP